MNDALGLEPGIVRLVEYDRRWPSLYATETRRIRAAAGRLPLTLEHIGSTAVPGMCSKPVLDILAGRPRGSAAEKYIACLHQAGYVHRGEQGVPGREFFRRGNPRAYHVHLVEVGGVLWQRYLAFRDYLRSDPAAARNYGQLKRSLAARFPHEREAYGNGKTEFVQEALLRSLGAD